MDNFDYKFYVTYYKDLIPNCINTPRKAQLHYYNFGKNEKRLKNWNEYLKSVNFDKIFYILLNDDLKDSFNTEKEIYNHYIDNGINENRVINFDSFIKKYVNFDYNFFEFINEENINNYLHSKVQIFKLYKKYNIDITSKEFRKAIICKIYLEELKNENSTFYKFNKEAFLSKEKFDYDFYINTYQDLSEKGIISKDEAIKHYLIHGKKESRKCNLSCMEEFHYEESNQNVIFESKKIKKEKKINILIRTCYRPILFRECINSIFKQDYVNFNIIIGYDNQKCLEYLDQYNDERIEKYYINIKGGNFKFELYCDILKEYVNDGWIIFLDDDDKFLNNNCLKIINYQINHENDILFWKFVRPDKLIFPRDLNDIKYGEVANSGYMFYNKFKNFGKWEEKHGGDFSFINSLINNCKLNKKFINKNLTGTIKNNIISSKGKKKISIIMAYYNRRTQIILTLDSFEKYYSFKYNIEVIIVDDDSKNTEKINDLIDKYNFDIKIINVINKNWCNSVIPYNIAISNISNDTDIVVIQHPEIFHCDNVLEFIINNINDLIYLSFQVFASPCLETNEKLRYLFENGEKDYLNNFVNKINYEDYGFDYKYYIEKNYNNQDIGYEKALNYFLNHGINNNETCNKYNVFYENTVINKWKGWYNHNIYNKTDYNFLVSVTYKTLKKLGGFCSEMKDGLWYEDNDFLNRAQQIVKIKTIESNTVFGIHQYHEGGSNIEMYKKKNEEKINNNKNIFLKNKENKIIYCNLNLENINYNILSYYDINFKRIKYFDSCHCHFCNFMNKKIDNEFPFNNYLQQGIPKILVKSNNPINTYVYFNLTDNLWIPKISVTNLNSILYLITNSNHFIDQYDEYQEIGSSNTKSHRIYSNIRKNYFEIKNKLQNYNNNIVVIPDKCIFLDNSFSNGNAGHDLYHKLSIINLYHDKNVKFVIFDNNNRRTNLIKLIIPKDRFIFIKENTLYNFKNEIFDYEHNYYDADKFKNLINIINNKIIISVEKNRNPYELKNKKVILIKNNYLKEIVRRDDVFDLTDVKKIFESKGWIILDPERHDLFLMSYILNFAKIIIIGQRGISAANQIFFNKKTKIYPILKNNIDKLEIGNLKSNNQNYDYLRCKDLICNSLYYDKIKNIILSPLKLKKNDMIRLINKIDCNSINFVNKPKIYIYNLFELDLITSTFLNLSPEMDIFDYFYKNLMLNYDIVNDINRADIAFIPIDLVKLIYISPHHFYSLVPENCPPRPEQTGIDSKKVCIEYFWNKYVDVLIKKSNLKKIPHFILYSYILFDINFDCIPKEITIFAYENYVSLYNEIKSNKIENEIIPIPYPLNDNKNFNQKKIEKYYFEEYDCNQILLKKKYDLGYFGAMTDSHTDQGGLINPKRKVMTYYRGFINKLNFSKYRFIKDEGKKATSYLPKIKYLFVLRGDTTTRLCFYQCYAFGVVPIIFEDEKKVYSNLLGDFNLLETVLILPNKYDFTEENYIKKIYNIIEHELSDKNNYLKKIQNFNKYFNNFNWYSNNSQPINNIIKYLKKKDKDNFFFLKKFHVLKINSKYHNILPIKISNNDILNTNNNIYYAENKVLRSQYSLELYFHNLFLKYHNSNFEECDYIYIPIHLFLLAWNVKDFFYDVDNIINNLNELMDIINELIGKNKIIILIYSDVLWENNECFINHFNFHKNVYIISYESISDKYNNNQINVPFITHIKSKPVLYNIQFKSKNNLICYAGRKREELNYFKNITIFFTNKYNNDKTQWISSNNIEMYEEIDSLYDNHYFSLQPHGDKKSRKGFYHSILLGCIPVIFESNFEIYEDIFIDYINLEEICVIIKDNELDSIEEILNSKIKDIQNKIKNINKIKHLLLYHDNNIEIIEYILNKIDY